MDKLPILMTRAGNRLVPMAALDAERIGALTYGQPVEVTVRQRRSNPNHRHFFAVLGRLVSSGAVPFKTTEQLLDALKLECGIVEYRQRLDGTAYLIPGSISFAKADEPRFQAFKDEAFKLLAETYNLDLTDIVDVRNAA